MGIIFFLIVRVTLGFGNANDISLSLAWLSFFENVLKIDCWVFFSFLFFSFLFFLWAQSDCGLSVFFFLQLETHMQVFLIYVLRMSASVCVCVRDSVFDCYPICVSLYIYDLLLYVVDKSKKKTLFVSPSRNIFMRKPFFSSTWWFYILASSAKKINAESARNTSDKKVCSAYLSFSSSYIISYRQQRVPWIRAYFSWKKKNCSRPPTPLPDETDEYLFRIMSHTHV